VADSVEQLEGDIRHLTRGLEALAKPDPAKWGGWVQPEVSKFAQEVLDTRWERNSK